MNNFKRKMRYTKNFVVRHWEVIAVGSVAAVVIVGQKSAIRMANEFIEEHGLTEEFIATMQ